jgi:rare lipoprotein A
VRRGRHPRRLRFARLAVGLGFVLALGLFSGCGTSPDIEDGAPSVVPRDLSTIPDAVPRLEARSPYGNPPEYEVFGQRYRTLISGEGFEERGLASWYGTKFHGRRTSSGEPYDMYAMTAAHKHLPLPSYVEVTNLDNGRRAIVRVNDRGPFVAGRVIDLSYAAAHRLGVAENGLAPVHIRVVGPDSGDPGSLRVAAASPTLETRLSGGSDIDTRFIQVGAFSSESAAEALQGALLDLGLEEVRITQVNASSGGVLHRVRIGPLDGADAVQNVSERLRQAALMDFRVVTD